MTELINRIDQTFNFNENTIRVLGTYDEPWFVAKDICNILGLTNITEALKNIPEKWRGSEILNTSGGNQNMILIKEPAVYKLVMRSNKLIAQPFQDAVCEEILPSIRKTGEFKLQKLLNEKEQQLQLKHEELQFKDYLLDKSEDKIKKLEKQFETKERQKYTLSNCVYLISNSNVRPIQEELDENPDKKFVKIGKTGNANGRLDNYCSGSPGEYKIDHSRKVCSKREESVIESLMLIIFSKYRTKNHINKEREWVATKGDITLETLKSEMDLLVNFMFERKKFYDPDFNPDINNDDHSIDTDKSLDFLCPQCNNPYKHESSLIKHISCSHKENAKKLIKLIKTTIETPKNDKVEIVFVEVENKKKVTKYSDDESENDNNDFEEIKNKNVNINPRDFDRFIEECCVVDKLNSDCFCPKSDLRETYKIWSNCTKKDVKKDFDEYINTKFKSGAEFIENSRRNIYRGVKVKQITFTPSEKNLDYERFITEKCGISHHYRISYADFYKYFEEYKRDTESNYKISPKYKKEIKNYLNSKFFAGRVYISNNEGKGGLHGIIGLGLSLNNYGLKIKKRKNKQVGEYNAETNELLQSFDSIILASKKLSIPFTTFNSYIEFSRIHEGKIYKLL